MTRHFGLAHQYPRTLDLAQRKPERVSWRKALLLIGAFSCGAWLAIVYLLKGFMEWLNPPH